jgi:putative tricarboxylic transport membrane protein
MMDMFSNLLLGFQVAASPTNLLYCLLGVTLGTLIGILPGIGPSATVALLLPLTFGMPDTAALIMLAGIFYGAQYGGSTTAILVNLPGESSSVVTCLDGHAMARQGCARDRGFRIILRRQCCSRSDRAGRQTAVGFGTLIRPA